MLTMSVLAFLTFPALARAGAPSLTCEVEFAGWAGTNAGGGPAAGPQDFHSGYGNGEISRCQLLATGGTNQLWDTSEARPVNTTGTFETNVGSNSFYPCNVRRLVGTGTMWTPLGTMSFSYTITSLDGVAYWSDFKGTTATDVWRPTGDSAGSLAFTTTGCSASGMFFSLKGYLALNGTRPVDGQALLGPDRDNDGWGDSEDGCPDQPGNVRGCPDRDNDGLIDSSDACPDQAGTAQGCPDRDGDSVRDSADECPDTPGRGTASGCPVDPDPCDPGTCTYPDPASEPEASAAAAPTRQPRCVGTNDYYLRVLYAYPSGPGRDNYSARVDNIRTIVKQMNGRLYQDAKASSANGARTAEFKVRCSPGGEISVMKFNSGPSADFGDVVQKARAAGHASTQAHYLIFLDARPPVENLAGMGTRQPDDTLSSGNANNTGPAYALMWNTAWTSKFALHEAAHNMGAVQRTAPNASYRGHCNDGRDVMCYDDRTQAEKDRGVANQYTTTTCPAKFEVFDCNFDDYFDRDPAAGTYLARQWNLGDPLNRFLAMR